MADTKTRIILEAVDQTKAAFDSAATGLRKVENVTTTLNGTLSRLAPLLGAATFTGLISNAVAAADKINDIAKANEVTVGSIIKLSQALSLNGGESENSSKLFSALTAKLEEAAGGSEKAQKQFAELGINLEDLAQLDGQQLFEKSLAGLQKIEDPIKRNALAMDVLGKSVKGVDIVGLADDYANNQTDFTDAEKAFKDIGLAMDKLDQFTTKTSTTLATNFGPVLLEIITQVDDLVFGFDKLEKNIRAARNAGKPDGGPFIAAPKITDKPALGAFNLPAEFQDRPDRREVIDAAAADRATALEQAIKKAADARKKLNDETLKGIQQDIDFEASQKDALGAYEKSAADAAKKLRENQDKASDAERLEINNMLYERKKSGEKLQEEILDGLDAETDELLFQVSIQNLSEQAQQEKIAARNVELRLAQAINDLNKEDVYLTEEQTDELREKFTQIETLNSKLKKVDGTAKDLGITFTSAFEDAVVEAKTLGEVIDGLGKDIIRILVRKNVTEPLAESFSGLFSGFGSLFTANANGGVYAGAGISAYSGSVVSSPTLFPFASGTGLMGEAGPEAILPLKRGANGKLGVEASGGNSDGQVIYNVSVHVDATGGKVQGDDKKANDLGRMIEGEIRKVILKEKRQGGMLS